jgi:CBS domain-containing protein
MPGKIPRTSIASIKSREPVRIRAKTPLLDVVKAMKEARRGAAIIEDNAETIIGIITERDLMTKIDHSTLNWHDIPVDKVMNPNPKTIKATQFLHEALAIMITCRFRHLPVVDAENHVLGIVSIRDIIMHVASLYPQQFLNLPPNPKSAAYGRYGG